MAADQNEFDPYHKWLGIPKNRRPPTHYDLLGLSLDEEDREVVRGAAEQRKRFVESQRGKGLDAAVNGILYQLSEAEVTLSSPEMRRDYDRRLDLFSKRRRKRQVDPNNTGSRIKSRPGRSVGEGSGIVGTFLGVMAVFVVGIGLMAWFSFQLPWNNLAKTDSKPAEAALAENPIKEPARVPLQPESVVQAEMPPNTISPVENRSATETMDRQVSLWVLGTGGTVEVRRNEGGTILVRRAEQLPSEKFTLVGIDLQGHSEVHDDDLKNLIGLNHLENLNLWGTGISDNGLFHLKDLSSLIKLWLVGTPVSGRGFQHFYHLDQLRELLCGGCPIVDSSLDYLSELSSLQFLGLVDTRVTDIGMKSLGRLGNLQDLRVRSNAITDIGLLELAANKKLKSLQIQMTQVTRNGILEFKSAVPGCEVNWE